MVWNLLGDLEEALSSEYLDMRGSFCLYTYCEKMLNVAGNVLKMFQIRTGRQKYVLWKKNPHCYYCGALLTYQESTIDHVVPVSVLKGPNRKKYKGLRRNPKNKVLSCLDCNTRKSSRKIPESPNAMFYIYDSKFKGEH